MDKKADQNRKEEKRRPLYGWRLLVLAAVLCAVSLAGMALALHGNRGDVYTPPPFDAAAVEGVPDVPQELGWQELDARAYRFSVCGVFAPVDGAADIWLTNPADNDVWIKLRVMDAEGNTLGETGLIRPGEYVQSVTLSTVPAEGETVTLKLMGYEPDTYYSAGAVSLETTVAGT